MPAASIKSRPVYAPLSPRPGMLHLFAAESIGAEAILELAGRAPPGFFGRAGIFYVSSAADDVHRYQRLRALRPNMTCEGSDVAVVMPRLAHVLDGAHMGTQLYLAGSEGFIGQAMKAGLDAGMELACIQIEHRGSEARRVQCVHCKGITADVRTQPVVCSHCHLTLFVRDHYSRRIAAFQGVRIDAEEPGVVPAVEELFR